MVKLNSENKVQLQSAFVLHARPFKETSLLVDLFTPDYGRVSVVAKGARSKNSKLKGVLQATLKLLVSWQGRGNLKTLTLAEMTEVPGLFDGEKMISVTYINELILKLTPNFDAVDGLFEIYETALKDLLRAKNVESTLRYFEKNFLACMGYELLLEAESDSLLSITPQADYVYVIEHGPKKVSSQRITRHTIAGATLLALANETLQNKQQLREAKFLLRLNLDHLLGGTVLKSRALMKSYLQKKQEHKLDNFR